MAETYYSILPGEQYFLCAHFEKLVDLYGMADLKKLRQAATLLDFGGDRLAISEGQGLFFCGNYEKGVAAYGIDDGKERWKNKMIKGVQTLRASDRHVFVHTEDDALVIFSLKEGAVLHTLKKISGIYPTENADALLLHAGPGLQVLRMEEDRCVRDSTGIEDLEGSFHTAALFDKKIFLYNLHESFRAYTMEGSLIWTGELEKGPIINAMAYDAANSRLSCLAGLDSGQQQDLYVFHFDAATGKLLNSYMLDAAVVGAGFSRDGKKVLCTNGQVLEAASGQLLGSFNLSL